MNLWPFGKQKPGSTSATAVRLQSFASTFGAKIASTGEDELAQLSAVAGFATSVVTSYAKSRNIATQHPSPRRDALLVGVLPLVGATCQSMGVAPFEVATLLCLTSLLPVPANDGRTPQQIGAEMADEQQRIIAAYRSAMTVQRFENALNSLGATAHELLSSGPSQFRLEELCEVMDSWLGVATYEPSQAASRREWVLSELTTLAMHREAIEMTAQSFVDDGCNPIIAIREATVLSLYCVDAGIRAAVSAYPEYRGLLEEWRESAKGRGRPGEPWDRIWAEYLAATPEFDAALRQPTPQGQGQAFGDVIAARLGRKFLSSFREVGLYSAYSISMVAVTKIVRGDPFRTPNAP